MKIDKSPWWKFPLFFGWEFDLPCPYIWLGWWLITWDRPWDKPKWYWPENIGISFQPD